MKEKKTQTGQYLSIPKAAAALGMSRVAIYKKVKSGDIKSIRIGKEYAIHRSSLSDIGGKTISSGRKKKINRAVKKVVKEYGELLRKLGNE